MADEVQLEVVVIGPVSRSRGRDYRLQQGGEGLSPGSRTLLGDFARALSEWGKGAPSRPFRALVPLGDDRCHLLLKGAYLRPGDMGSICVAQGILIPDTVLEAIQWKAHRWLPEVPEPAIAHWEANSVAINLSSQSPALSNTAEPNAALSHVADLVATAAECVTVHTVQPMARGEWLTLALLDTIPWHRLGAPCGWITTDALPTMDHFSPSLFRMATSSLQQMPATLVDEDIYTDGEVVFHGQRQVPAAWQVLNTLFRHPLPLAPDEVEAGAVGASERACEALLLQRWQPGYAELAPSQVVMHATGMILKQGLSAEEFWDVLAVLARNIRRLDDAALRAEAAIGIAALFERRTSHDPAVFANSLSNFIARLWGDLPGQEDLPVRLALERDVLGRIATAELQALLETGLVTDHAERFAALLADHLALPPGAEGRLSGAHASVILTVLRNTFAETPARAEDLATVTAALSLAAGLLRESGPADARLAREAGSLATLATSGTLQSSSHWRDSAPALTAAAVAVGASQPQSFLTPWVSQVRERLASRQSDTRGFMRPGPPTTQDFADLLLIHNLLTV